jgi:hypothetical protein
LLFREETYIILSPHGGDDADEDDIMYNRSFFIVAARDAMHCVSTGLIMQI